MGVLTLPVDIRVLSISLDRRRSIQESAFTGATRFVVNPGAVWRGHIELPPITDNAVWKSCRHVLQRVYAGNDRLAVPYIAGGDPDFDIPAAYADRILSGQTGTLNLRAALNKAGDRLVLWPPVLTSPNWAWTPPPDGCPATVLWGSSVIGDNIDQVHRAAFTQLELRVNPGAATEFINTELGSLALADIQTLPATPTGGQVTLSSWPLATFAFNSDFAIYRCNPAVPQAYREAVQSAAEEWSLVQCQVWRPFLPAIIANDDALGHEMSDRAILPNRIEFVSSSVWP